MQFIMRGVYEGDRAASREFSDFAELLSVLSEFRHVAPTKLIPVLPENHIRAY